MLRFPKLDVPWIVTFKVLSNTPKVLTGKVADVCPAGIVTDPGIVSPNNPSNVGVLKDTVAPPAGAGPFSETVPVAEPSKWIEPGLSESPFRIGA